VTRRAVRTEKTSTNRVCDVALMVRRV
jgi:hypothetical protein